MLELDHDGDLVERYDVVVIERRDVRPTDTERCRVAIDELLSDGLAAGFRNGLPIAEECEVPAEPTVEIVDEIARLARLGRYSAVSFLAASYGSATAVLFAERYPELVGRIALDSPSPVGTSWENQVAAAVSTIRSAKELASSAACSHRHSPCDPHTGFDDLERMLVSSTSADRGYMQLGVLELLRNWPDSAGVLRVVLADNDSTLLATVGRSASGNASSLVSSVARRLSIECADIDRPPTIAQAMSVVSRYIADGQQLAAIAAAQVMLCARTNASPAPYSVAASRVARAHPPPAIVTVFERDLIAPAAVQRALAMELRAQLVVTSGTGHGHLAIAGCGGAALINFLLERPVPSCDDAELSPRNGSSSVDPRDPESRSPIPTSSGASRP